MTTHYLLHSYIPPSTRHGSLFPFSFYSKNQPGKTAMAISLLKKVTENFAQNGQLLCLRLGPQQF